MTEAALGAKDRVRTRDFGGAAVSRVAVIRQLRVVAVTTI